MSPEQDDHRDEDEHEDYASRSIFSAGWFRAVLVLTVFAIVVVVSLPYLLNWFEPAPPTSQAPASAPAVAQVPKPEPSPTPIVSPPPAASPAAPAPPPKATEKPAAPAALPPAKMAEKPSAAPAPPPAKVTEKPSPAPTLPPAKTTEKPAPLPSAVKPVSQVSKPVEAARAKEPVSRPAKPASAATPPGSTTGSYWVQLGVFKEQGNAEGLAKSLRSSGFPVEVTRITRGGGANPGTYYMVRAGGFPDRDRALAARDELKTKGHAGILAQGPAK